MSDTAGTIQTAEPLHGLRQIVRLNWPFYAVGTSFVLVAPRVIDGLPFGVRLHVLLYVATALAAFWLVASLIASWIVYDRSKLMQCDWVGDVLQDRSRTWINIHAGLDETTPVLRHQLAGSQGRVFDIFDAVEMTEPSIARARRLARNEIDPERADFRCLPAVSSTIDLALLLFSAHELRSVAARRALFVDLHRVLAPGGRVVIAEHLRDCANFIAFGPGFLHFHPRGAWTRCFAEAGFAIHEEFSITPFVRVFVLGRVV